VFCDGAVDIKESTPGREITGGSEHAEYYPTEERFLLTGGNPVVVDSRRGTTRGAVITWYSRQDRLEVDNSGSGPAVSRVNQDKKKKK
jgi:lipopolysaccharide export system protein LptA